MPNPPFRDTTSAGRFRPKGPQQEPKIAQSHVQNANGMGGAFLTSTNRGRDRNGLIKKEYIMNGKNSVSLWALVLALINGGQLLAEPLMTSLQTGQQAPDPINPGSSASYTISLTKTNS